MSNTPNAENILKQLSVDGEIQKPNTEATIILDTPPTPKASAVGLDDSVLDTPTIPNLNKMTAAIEDTRQIESINTADTRFDHLLVGCTTSEEKTDKLASLQRKYTEIVKDLVINLGLTQPQAETAAMNRLTKETKEEIEQKAAQNPEIGVVTIDKTADVNELGMTEEEHRKLERVKRIKLIVVDNADLETMVIERPDEEFKANYVRSIDNSLSKYGVPMPMYGDFLHFKGAQIMQMINCVEHEDTKVEELINTKASLIYDKLINGAVMRKTDDNGTVTMTYEQFINRFPYQDLDMGIYGIVCASSMEESATSLTCEACKTTWEQKYHIKTLLKLDHLTDAFKERLDNIIKNSTNTEAITPIVDSMRKAKRYKSPFSKNVYDVSYPTVARALNILRRIDDEDSVMAYISAVAIYLSNVYIYNPNKGSHVEITSQETDLLLDTLRDIPDADLNMLASQVRADLFYEPKFEMDTHCPNCSLRSKLPLSIKNLIFLKAQDSSMEIES